MELPQSSAPLTGSQIDQYLSPYLNDVMGSTSKLLGQQNEQAQSGQLGNAIRSGAFGGDRTGIAARESQSTESMASANILSGIANQGYQSALSTAQGSSRSGLLAREQLADIGSTAYGEGATTASEMGALGVALRVQDYRSTGSDRGRHGTAANTTGSGYGAVSTVPAAAIISVQTAQFLANIAEGTGALSGSTTTTTQPAASFPTSVSRRHGAHR